MDGIVSERKSRSLTDFKYEWIHKFEKGNFNMFKNLHINQQKNNMPVIDPQSHVINQINASKGRLK